MKPLNAIEIKVHSDLSEYAVEQAISQLIGNKLFSNTYLKVSVWDAMIACQIMVKSGLFQIIVTPHYALDEWSVKTEESEVWSPGA